MELRGFVALLVGVLVALGALAFATPPDQTWIGGFYDDADFDDVVLLVTEYTFGVASVTAYDAAPFFVVVVSVPAFEARPAPVPPFGSDAARAPPAA